MSLAVAAAIAFMAPAVAADTPWVRIVSVALVAACSALAGMMAEHRYPSAQLRRSVQRKVYHETYARNCRYNNRPRGFVTRDDCPICPPLEANR